MQKGNGFTLIELPIVLAILGILVGIVAMSVEDLETTAEGCAVRPEQQIVQDTVGANNGNQASRSSANSVTPAAVVAFLTVAAAL
jgi:prepilin-type N-terminal cleavage/methylation domain-containing protein